MMQLSKRLQAVANLVTDTECVADVGTDHGYIPIYLIEHGICRRAIAMDIKKGPLQRAQEHIREHQLGAYIQTRLSDGLSALQKEEAATIVIAGMGGATMCEILEAGNSIIVPTTMLVLQPQSELEDFRRYLKGHGFCFLAEDMVLEDGKYYPMMKVCKNGQKEMPAHPAIQKEGVSYDSKLEMMYGPLLLQQRHPVLREYLLWQLAQKERIRLSLAKNAAPKNRTERSRQIEEEINCIRQALRLFNEG